MATAALPHPRRAARAERHLRKFTAAAGRFLSPAKPVWANLAAIPLTVAGIGCLDATAFLWNFLAGLALTGVSLIVLEAMIADES